MSTGNTVGLPVPKLLPITGTSTVPLVLLGSVLSLNVSRWRKVTKVLMGSAKPGTSQSTLHADELHTATRAHLNFLENVPFALVLCACVELNGGSRKVLTGTMAALFAARVVHALALLNGSVHIWFRMRQVGAAVSLGVQLGLASWTGWLCKGYWGL